MKIYSVSVKICLYISIFFLLVKARTVNRMDILREWARDGTRLFINNVTRGGLFQKAFVEKLWTEKKNKVRLIVENFSKPKSQSIDSAVFANKKIFNWHIFFVLFFQNWNTVFLFHPFLCEKKLSLFKKKVFFFSSFLNYLMELIHTLFCLFFVLFRIFLSLFL